MSVDRLTRLNELLRRELGELLYSVFSDTDLDLSAVTVTHVMIARGLREARVLVSIRGNEALRRRVMGLLHQRRAELQSRVSHDVVMKFTPRLNFELDTSLERGDHVLQVLSELVCDEHAPAPPEAQDQPARAETPADGGPADPA